MNSNNNIDLGFDAHQRGDYQLALNFYEQALSLSPSDAEALSLKGNVLSLLNRCDEAEVSLKKAVELEPEVSGFWLNLADHYVRNNKINEGCQLIIDNVSYDDKNKQVWQFLYQAGLKSDKLSFSIIGLKRLIDVEFNFNALISLSQLLVRDKQFNEAIELLKSYQHRCTNQNPYWHALCWLLNSQRQWRELKNHAQKWLVNISASPDAIRYIAAADFETGLFHNAIALYENKLLNGLDHSQPNQNDAVSDDLINYITVCISALELQKAEEAINKALALGLSSSVIANAQIQLAVFRGELPLAEQMCMDCIEQFPDYFPVYIQLARIAPEKISEQQIERIIQYVKADHSDSDALAFVLGHYFHEKNQSENAWNWYCEANRLREVRSGERGSGYKQSDADNFERNIIKLEESLADMAVSTVTETAGESDITPVFVLGMPRSGSTLLEGLLAQHSKICKTGERIEFPNFIYGLANESFNKEELQTTLQEFKRLYIKNSTNSDQGYSCYIDKNPSNYLTVGLIKSVFPNAVIINIRRTPIETIWSIFRHEFSHLWSFATSIDNIAHQYTVYERLMGFWNERYSDVITLHYEELVENPTAIVSAVLEQIGLDSTDIGLPEGSAQSSQTKSASLLKNQEFTTLSAVQVRGEIRNLNGQAKMYQSYLTKQLDNYPKYLISHE